MCIIDFLRNYSSTEIKKHFKSNCILNRLQNGEIPFWSIFWTKIGLKPYFGDWNVAISTFTFRLSQRQFWLSQRHISTFTFWLSHRQISYVMQTNYVSDVLIWRLECCRCARAEPGGVSSVVKSKYCAAFTLHNPNHEYLFIRVSFMTHYDRKYWNKFIIANEI